MKIQGRINLAKWVEKQMKGMKESNTTKNDKRA
jgi:hypothetical protein